MNMYTRVFRNISMSCLLILPVTGWGVPGELADKPLFLGGGNVPGNMVLVPSVEWPTIESVANITNTYTSAQRFEGYFDSAKCYQYNYSSTESERHFSPSSMAGTNRQCAGSGEWSGNFLNWATTQTVDPFRKALTGGLRVRDTPTETWLEKARHPGQGNGFPIRDLNNATEVAGATPFSAASRIRVRIGGLGTRMRFSLGNTDVNTNVLAYTGSNQGDQDPYTSGRGYDMSVRVKVCDASVGLESNCVQYSQGWKPEGLIQQNADNIRYSIFGYLNDSSENRDGGILRARQKFVGPNMLVPNVGSTANANAEWDATTGVIFANPDPADASATHSSITNSGVINYLNKFGQLNSGNNKSIDPVSELYYTATRYLKNLGNVPAYTSMAGADDATRNRWRDGFPVITDWDDPIQYECQPNVILGIGDANTHRDKNLPGNTTYRTGEPGMPSEVSADTTVNVITETNRVGQLEGFGDIANTNSFTGRSNSAYIAGLAYDNHTRDLRPLMAGTQTASTYWVDVLENQVLERASRNQYYLATKYGGFEKPEGFDPDARTDPLEDGWWHTTGEMLTPNSGSAFKRPDNYYLAGEAAQMIASLEAVFSDAGSELAGNSASISFNSTSLETDSLLFGARFDASDWSGEFFARSLGGGGGTAPSLQASDTWEAGDILDARDLVTDPRQIITYNGTSGVAFSQGTFDSGILSNSQRQDLLAGGASTAEAKARLSFLRGEAVAGLRNRGSRLGDIVNSSPIFVGKPSLNWPSGAPFGTSTATYNGFKVSQASRAPVVYVGGNDGMLHAFSGREATADGGGRELFGYVPNFLSSDQSEEGLHYLTETSYEHRYYVDLTPSVSDVYMQGAGVQGDAWRTVLIGGGRTGGKGLFALDVTDPSTFSETNAANLVLWEFTAADSNGRLGYITEPPLVVMAPWGSNDFRWTAIFGNGYNSGSDETGLFMLDLEGGLDGTWTEGTDYRFISFESGSGSGLSAVTAVDLTGNRIADRIYAGDLKGQMWVASAASNGTWDAAYKQGQNALPLFTAELGGRDQPITAAPAVVRSPLPGADPNLLVLFGTGQYLTENDTLSSDVESYYGITDRGVAELDRSSNLLERQLSESTVVVGGDSFNVREAGGDVWANEAGWYVDFVTDSGERIVQTSQVRGKYAFVNSTIPNSDPCAAGGDGWIMAFGLDGRTPDRAVFKRFPTPVVGYKTEGGMPNQSGFIGDYLITPLSDNTFLEDEIDLGPGAAQGRLSWQELYE